MKKQLISSIASLAIIMNTVSFNLTANAKVIEPEIVKTETWTTSYFIDDDMETLYPYIDCQADIYNDGTVKVYFWNTHEWDGFATVKHNIILVNSLPVNNRSMAYSFSKLSHPISCIPVSSISGVKENYKFWESKDVGFYSNVYNYELNHTYPNYNYTYYYRESGTGRKAELSYIQYNCALPELSVNVKSSMVFSPTTELTETYDFYVLGHNFTITPELLSGNVVAEPQPSASEQKIKELEEKIANLESENVSLKAENEQLKNGLISDSYGDINQDNIIDGRDATILLTYYAKVSTDYTGTLEEYVESLDIN